MITLACLTALGAGLLDARSGKIPNRLTLVGVPLALALAGALGGLVGAGRALLGLTVCGGVLALPYFATRGRALGGGDVKCWALLGALLGPELGLSALLASLGILVLYALLQEAFFGRLLSLVTSTLRVTVGRRSRDEVALTPLRFGPAIAAGTLLSTFPDLRVELESLCNWL